MGLGRLVDEMAGGQKGKLRDETRGSRVLYCAIMRSASSWGIPTPYFFPLPLQHVGCALSGYPNMINSQNQKKILRNAIYMRNSKKGEHMYVCIP